MRYSELESFVLDKLERELPDYLHYHNVGHTKEVIERTSFLAEANGLDEMEVTKLKTAALLHDIGYVWDSSEHEKISARYALKHLPEWGYEQKDIKDISEMILATQIPQSPKSLSAEMLCDADLSYLGSDKFKAQGDDLCFEFEKRGIIDSEDVWDEFQIKFLESHRYHTDYAKEHWEPVKQRHLENLKRSRNTNV